VGHINDLYDFTVTGVIVRDAAVLMVHHAGLERWLFPGGHIELDEDPDLALDREMAEECGIPVRWLESAPGWPNDGGHVKFLRRPHRAEVHPITDRHSHITFVYYGVAVGTGEPVLAAAEHHAIRWVTSDELDDPALGLADSLKCYAREAMVAASAHRA
jgi:8-oxo-dGTP pyrophosphatase MutT (NUDIX family)